MSAEPVASRTIQDLVYAFMPAQILGAAARLRIADVLANRRMTVAELATATETHQPSLRRLLRALTCLDVVVEPEAGVFELAAGGHYLRADVADSIRAAVMLFTSGEVWRAWSELDYGVRTGNIAWDHALGMSVFEFMDRNPDQSATFNAAMADRTRVVSPDIVASYDFSGFGTLVDLGGGDGELIATILAATPSLRGIVFDQPAGIAGTEDRLRAAGVADRCDVVSGDFLVGVPEGADAYTLKSVIHNWDDEQAVTILGNCRKAIRESGRVLVIERVLPRAITSPEVRHAVFSDVNMMVTTPGRERTGDEFRALFAAAGFTLAEVVPTGPGPIDYQVLVGAPG